MTINTRILLTALIAALFALVWCNRPKQTEPAPDKRLQAELNPHAIRSQIEAEYRQRETVRFKAYTDSLAQNKVIVQAKGVKAVASVKAYQKAPSIAKADTAIADLQDEVVVLKFGALIADSVIASQSRINASQASTILRQDSVIVNVAKIGQDALAENAKLSRKLRNRNRVLAIIGGVGLGVIGGLAVSR